MITVKCLPSEYIEKHGWIQGSFYDVEGRCCAMGAIMSCSNEYDYLKMKRRLSDMLAGYGWLGIATWNDAHGRTKDEVIDMLKKLEQELELVKA